MGRLENSFIYAFVFMFLSISLHTKTISIQGLLTDQNDQILPDGNYSLEFNIYNLSTGGTSQWTETQLVSISNGIFNAHLGSVNALNLNFDSQYWVGIKVGTDPELSPRIKLTYSPYSMYAIAIADNTVNSNKIDDGTIAGVDLSQMGATNGQVLEWNGTTWVPITHDEFTLPLSESKSNSGALLELINPVGSAFKGVGPNGEIGILGINTRGVEGSYPGRSKGQLGTVFYGVYGEIDIINANAIYGINNISNNSGYIGGHYFGVNGSHGNSLNYGYLGGVSYGVYGKNNSSSNEGYLGGPNVGVQGKHDATNNYGYLGGSIHGVYGEVPVGINSAVYGLHGNVYSGALGGSNQGVLGYNISNQNRGMLGASQWGVSGDVTATNMFAVQGYNHNSNKLGYFASDNYGAYGYDENTDNYGYIGSANYGVFGQVKSGTDKAVFGSHDTGGNHAYLADNQYAVYGYGNGGNFGYIGSADRSVYGEHNSGNYGYLGSNTVGVFGQNSNNIYGYLGGSNIAVYGKNDNSDNYGYIGGVDLASFARNSTSNILSYLVSDSVAVYGEVQTGSDKAIYGKHGSSNNYGYLGGETYGVYGKGSQLINAGVYGEHGSGNYGYLGGKSAGVYGGNTSSGNYGYLASGTYGVYGRVSSGSNEAIYGENDGSLSKGYLAGGDYGVYGEVDSGTSKGVRGEHNASGNIGYLGSNSFGAYGKNGVTGTDGYLGGLYGVEGKSNGGDNGGRIGGPNFGVYAYNSNGRTAYLATDTYSANLTGNAYISGKLGINESSPSYGIHLPNSTSFNEGIGRAHSWTTYSDSRLKMNQRDIDYGIETIMQITAKRYDHHSSTFENGFLKLLPESENTIGLIAQEVFEIVPEAVTKPEDENRETWGMEYTKLIPVLIKGMQEQQEIIENQHKRIEELESKLDMILDRIEK